jgi:hypothetical protein
MRDLKAQGVSFEYKSSQDTLIINDPPDLRVIRGFVVDKKSPNLEKLRGIEATSLEIHMEVPPALRSRINAYLRRKIS